MQGEAQEVSISYAGKQALAGISLQIHRNRITAIIGPSGCGKTTFLRSLNRMNDSVPGPDAPGLKPPAQGIPSPAAAERYGRVLERLATPYAVDSQRRASRSEYAQARWQRFYPVSH